MQKIQVSAYLTATLMAAISFIIIEFLVESIFFRSFGISEEGLYTYFKIYPEGYAYHIINLGLFFLMMCLIMVTYVLIRPRFSSDLTATLITSGIFITLMFLYMANLSNMGIYPLTIGITSIIFNIIELPFSVMIGAVTYTARAGNK